MLVHRKMQKEKLHKQPKYHKTVYKLFGSSELIISLDANKTHSY